MTMVELNFDSMTTEQLREQLCEELELTVTHLIRAAKIWVAFAARPDADLTEFRGGVFTYLPLIASGEVLAEVVYRFIGDDRLCKAIASLPPLTQREVLDTGAVPLAVYQAGQFTHRMIPLDEVTRSQIPILFDGPRVRPVEEQKSMLQPPPFVPWKRKPKRTRVGNVTVDRERGTVSIVGGPAPVEDVIRALRGAGMVP